jgi:hypothetical protein
MRGIRVYGLGLTWVRVRAYRLAGLAGLGLGLGLGLGFRYACLFMYAGLGFRYACLGFRVWVCWFLEET